MSVYETLGHAIADLEECRNQLNMATTMLKNLKDGTLNLDDIHIGPVAPEVVAEPVEASVNGAKPDEA